MRYIIVVCCIAGLMAFGSVARAQSDDASKAQELAAAGKWGEAIDTYARFLKQLNPMQYRDKKDFGWIVEEYEKSAAKGDYAALKSVVNEERTKHPKDEIYTWRLHRLLAEIADKAGDKDALKQELDLAIAAYPAKVVGDPSKLSSLQHLYNQRALLDADKDLAAAEDYLLKSFKEDKRFVYFFGSPWAQWYVSKGQPEKYAALAERVLAAYDEKAKANPSQRTLLRGYAGQLRDSLKK